MRPKNVLRAFSRRRANGPRIGPQPGQDASSYPNRAGRLPGPASGRPSGASAPSGRHGSPPGSGIASRHRGRRPSANEGLGAVEGAFSIQAPDETSLCGNSPGLSGQKGQ